MDILNFSSPYGGTSLNFGANEGLTYEVFNKVLDPKVEDFSNVYIEFQRTPQEGRNSLRYVKYQVVNIETFKVVDRGSSKFLKEDFYSDYSLNIDLKPFKDLQVNIVLEFHIEQLEESLDFKGISNLKAFLGK